VYRRLFCCCIISVCVITLASSYLAASGIEGLELPHNYRAARISSYDVTGGNNDGSQSNPVRPSELRTIADIKGPGKLVHIWFTLFAGENMDLMRDTILRIYWDGEKTPSVEVPIGEFFGLGHGKYYTFDSFPIEIGNDKGLSCFWPMPFKKSARITVENQGKGPITDFYYFIDYQVMDKPSPDTLYFHAQYRQAKPILTRQNYTFLDARGRGHYVGCCLYVRANDGGWWGEGDDMFYVDGAAQPTLHGTGVEDYFCHSWGFAKDKYALRFGAPMTGPWAEGAEHSVYRFHIEDAIPFRKSLRFTMEHAYGGYNDRADDWSSVAYWYQTEPHAPFPKLPSPEERRSMAERLELYQKQNRLTDYRNLLSNVMQRSTSGHVRDVAAAKLVDSYKSTGDSQKAVESLLLCAGPFPYGDARDGLMSRIRDLGGDPNVVPLPQAFPVDSVDGQISNTIVDGMVCQRTNKSEGSPFMYFRVIDKALRSGDRTVQVKVEYYDSGKRGDVFSIEYDSAKGDDAAAKYARTPVFSKAGVKGWHEAEFTLPRAHFAQRENAGADFRISAGPDQDEYIRDIRVSE
jgi:hypothetical protein